jgi:hypothetical protein
MFLQKSLRYLPGSQCKLKRYEKLSKRIEVSGQWSVVSDQ